MARSTSGRIVLQIDPQLKRALYSRLAMEGRTLKDWVTAQIAAYLGPDEDHQNPRRVPRRVARSPK